MPITKKPDSPYYYVRFSIKGKRIQECSYTTIKSEAKLFEERRRHELRNELLLGIKPKKLWQDAVTRWIKESSHKRTINQDILMFKWLDKHLHNKYLDELTKDYILSLFKQQEKADKIYRINRFLALIRAILNKAYKEWEWINKVPHFKMLPEPKHRIKYLSYEEASRLLKELPNHLKVMAKFTLATGLRQSNVTKLKWENVDLITRRLKISSSDFKTNKDVGIYLNQDALDILKNQQGRHSLYVFTYRNQPIHQVSTRAWYKALKRAGIKDFRWHDLRHTWASWHIQNGTSLQELQALGGWSSFNMVLRYAHLSPDNLKEASERVLLPR